MHGLVHFLSSSWCASGLIHVKLVLRSSDSFRAPWKSRGAVAAKRSVHLRIHQWGDFFLLIPTIDLMLTDQSVTSSVLWFSPFPEAWNILLVFSTWPCALWDGVVFYIEDLSNGYSLKYWFYLLALVFVPFFGDHPAPLLLNLPLTKPVSVALNKTIIAQLSKWAGCSCTDHCVHPFSASLQVIYLCLHRSMFPLYFSSQSGLSFYHGGSRPAIDPSGRACTESPSSIWDNPYISIKMERPKTQRQWLVGTARMLQRWL